MEKNEVLLALLIGISLLFSIMMVSENTRWIKKLMRVLDKTHELYTKGAIDEEAAKELMEVLNPRK